MIDWHRVTELKTDVLGDDFAEVFLLFLEEVEEVLSRLRENTDLSKFEEDFHFLKGSAVNVGFTEFGELCQAAEKAASSGEAARIDVESVIAAYEASVSAFMDRAHEFGLAA